MTSQTIVLTGQTAANLTYQPLQGKRWRILGLMLSLTADSTSGTRSVRATIRRAGANVGENIAYTGNQTTVSTTYYAVGGVGAGSPFTGDTVATSWGSHPEVAYPDALVFAAVLISGDTYDVYITMEELND